MEITMWGGDLEGPGELPHLIVGGLDRQYQAGTSNINQPRLLSFFRSLFGKKDFERNLPKSGIKCFTILFLKGYQLICCTSNNAVSCK